jgi:hypothetical protein
VSGPPARATYALCVALLAVLALPGPAAGARPCGEQVVDDWWDNGRIDRIYDLACYDDAEHAIPSDIRPYSDVDEVIARALQAATRGRLAQGGVDPTPSARGSTGPPGAETPAGPASGSEGTTQVAGEVDPGASGSIPLPLVVLAVMSLALLAAGALGSVSRRRRGDGLDEHDPQ